MSHRNPDVIIVGAGIMGLSIAHQIQRRSKLAVSVVEKGAGLGEGSTGGSAAITRQRYTQPESIRIARDSNVVFRNWAVYTGLAEPQARHHVTGVVWILREDKRHVEAEAARLAAEGIDAEAIGPRALQERFPALSTCAEPFDLASDIDHNCHPGEAFLVENDSGYFDATAALADLALVVRRGGGDLRLRARVVDVATDGDRVTGVVLADGSVINGGIVINAAGPWCDQLNTMAGLALAWPLIPTRVQVIYRDLPADVARPIPVVGDAITGVYFRPETAGQQILMGSILEEDELEEADPDYYQRTADRTFVDRKIHGLHHRIPSLPHIGNPRGMAGMYTINRTDVHPIVGPTPIDGFIVVNGFSGHGFKESPMVGSMVAQWLTGERAPFDTDVPIEFFSIDRDPIATAERNVLA